MSFCLRARLTKEINAVFFLLCRILFSVGLPAFWSFFMPLLLSCLSFLILLNCLKQLLHLQEGLSRQFFAPIRSEIIGVYSQHAAFPCSGFFCDTKRQTADGFGWTLDDFFCHFKFKIIFISEKPMINIFYIFMQWLLTMVGLITIKEMPYWG